MNTVLPRGIEYSNLTSGRGFAPGPSVPHATVDPFAAPMPAKVKAEQALHFAESLARGEPNRKKIVLTHDSGSSTRTDLASLDQFIQLMEEKSMRLAIVRTSASAVLAILLSYLVPSSAEENVASIIRRSVEANNRDWAAVPEFDNRERDRTKDGDKTYAVTILYGSPYQRLIAVNGQPVSPQKEKEEQKKYQQAVEQRKHESADKRAARIAKYEAERKRDRNMLDQMTRAFDFHLTGEKELNGRRVYELKATPRKGYQPPNRDSQVLTGMEGTLWIDRDTLQWVKVEAHVTRPVKIVGFLAEVEPGTYFELEKKPVAGDENIWMAAHFAMKSRARVMLLIPHHGEEDDSFFDYHKSAAVAQSAKSEAR